MFQQRLLPRRASGSRRGRNAAGRTPCRGATVLELAIDLFPRPTRSPGRSRTWSAFSTRWISKTSSHRLESLTSRLMRIPPGALNGSRAGSPRFTFPIATAPIMAICLRVEATRRSASTCPRPGRRLCRRRVVELGVTADIARCATGWRKPMARRCANPRLSASTDPGKRAGAKDGAARPLPLAEPRP